MGWRSISARLSFVAPVIFLKRAGVGLAGANAHDVLDRHDEDFSVANLAGLSSGGDDAHYLLQLLTRDSHLDAHFRQETDNIFGTAVNLRMALLAAVAFDLGHGHAVDADKIEGVADLFELLGFDNFMMSVCLAGSGSVLSDER